MNGAETSTGQEHRLASQEPSAEGDQITLSNESKDSENIVLRPKRMVRKVSMEMTLF